MPRQPRLDTFGALHHIIGRGIERTKIFRNEEDRIDFINRLAALCREKALVVYAWALMSNHYHLLVRTGKQPLSSSMRRLLTGYVVNFNRRHKRYGHLFQNRYKSIICEDDFYLLELTRYIHLNPLRAGIVGSLKELPKYKWTGHRVIMGKARNDWQDVDTVLAYFSSRRKEAIVRYESFIREGIAAGRRPELTGGGLVRSAGGWAQVKSLRRKGKPIASDERILGSGEFIERLFAEAEQRERETLRLAKRVPDLKEFAERIAKLQKIESDELLMGSRKREFVKARKIFCQAVVKKGKYSGADTARFLGISTSAVNRLANADELPEVEKIIS
jgi:REP element-mobilizing transposase RayT